MAEGATGVDVQPFRRQQSVLQFTGQQTGWILKGFLLLSDLGKGVLHQLQSPVQLLQHCTDIILCDATTGKPRKRLLAYSFLHAIQLEMKSEGRYGILKI